MTEEEYTARIMLTGMGRTTITFRGKRLLFSLDRNEYYDAETMELVTTTKKLMEGSHEQIEFFTTNINRAAS